MSTSRDAKRKRHSTKKRRSIRSSHSDHHNHHNHHNHHSHHNNRHNNNNNNNFNKRHSNHSDGNSAIFNLAKRRGLNINLSATPIKSLARNTKKARSKPTSNTRDIAKNIECEPYNFIVESQYKKSINSRYKKRISAPIILPTSTTTPSLSSMSTTTTTSTTTFTSNTTNTPNTPYYTNTNTKSVNGNNKYNHNNNHHHHKKRTKIKKKRHNHYYDHDDSASNNTLTTNSNSNSRNSNSRNANTNYEETQIIQKPTNKSIITNNYSSKSITHSIQSTLSYDDVDDDHHDESDEYLDDTEINEMIRSCRRISKSRPRAYSKSRRVSQKLYGLMEGSMSFDDDNNDDKKTNNNNVYSVHDEVDDEVDDDDNLDGNDYHVTLEKYGYREKKVIAKSLQGIVIEAVRIRRDERDCKDESVIIKITNKRLHFNKISNKHGKSLSVQEDIIKEKKLLMYLTANNPPSSLVKFLGFFSDKINYFLVMENGGSDFFDWIVKCHKWIRQGKLSLKQWNLYIHDLMLQIIKFLKWLHYKMNVCHLDISLENMLIKNNKYKSDGNGGIRLSRKMQIKFCDFGLAEYFSEKSFLCKKYVGKTHYKAPKVYGKKELFDARKADIWSLGVSFFMMIIGAPPYKLPIDTDDHFPLIKQNNVIAILKRWGRDHYINKHTESLLNQMLQINENKRISIYEIENHPYFNKSNNNHKHSNIDYIKRKKKKKPIIKKRRSTQDILLISSSSSKYKQRKPSNPIHTNIMATYHDNGALMESDNNINNNHNHSSSSSSTTSSPKIKGHHNIFQNLVMSDDDGQLFRYRKRKLTST